MPTKDNSLGAPAEGFGQNVTFARNPDQRGMPQAQAVGVQLVNSDVRGQPIVGGTPQAQFVNTAAPLDGSLALLYQLGETVLNKKIKEGRQNRFLEGMQAAQNGAAVSEVADSEPWWSQLFGKGDAVEGARQYTQHARVAETVAGWESSMQDLRKLSGEEAKTFFKDSINKSMTGDAATDAAMMQAYSSIAPSTMKRQAKEFVAYQQEAAVEAYDGLIDSQANLFQARMASNDKITPEEAAVATSDFAMNFVPPDAVNLAQRQSAVVGAAHRMAEKGQMYSLNALVDAIEHGGLHNVLGKASAQIMQIRDTGERQAIGKYAEKWGSRLTAISMLAHHPEDQPGLTPQGIADMFTVANEQGKKELGIRQDWIPESFMRTNILTTADKIEQTRRYNYAQTEKARVAADKAGNATAAHGMLVGLVKDAAVSGSIGILNAQPHVTKEQTSMIAFTEFLQKDFDGSAQDLGKYSAGTVGQAAGGQVNSFLADQLKQQFRAALGNGNLTEWANVYNNATKLARVNGGGEAGYANIDSYMGEDAAARISIISRQLGDTYADPKNPAFVTAVSVAMQPGAVKQRFLSPEELKEGTKVLKSALNPGWFTPSKLPGVYEEDMSQEQLGLLAQQIQPLVARRGAVSNEAAWKAGAAEFFNDGGVSSAGFAWRRPKEARKTGITDLLSEKAGVTIGTDEANGLLRRAIKDHLGSDIEKTLQVYEIGGNTPGLVFVDSNDAHWPARALGWDVIGKKVKEYKTRKPGINAGRKPGEI